jgi:MFS superfamily sulfate permease-like transporter
MPGLMLLRRHRGAALRGDVVGGVVLAALLVPQGMAYAELAGVPPVTWLYATFVPLVVYFLLGPSRILVLGPDSAVSPLVAAAIVPLAVGGDASERVALAGLLAILVGAIMLAGGLGRFGFVTELLSMPVRLGYLMGIAATVIAAQLPKLFGFSVEAENLIPAVRDFIAGLDETNVTALAIGAGSLALILGLRRLAPKVPGVFLAVVGATLAVAALGVSDEVPVVGEVPAGLPSFDAPAVSLEDLETLLPAAVGIAFVAFTDTSVLSRTTRRGCVRMSTRTRSSRCSASRTSRPGSSRGSLYPRAAPGPPLPRTSARVASSSGSPVPPCWRCCSSSAPGSCTTCRCHRSRPS